MHWISLANFQILIHAWKRFIKVDFFFLEELWYYVGGRVKQKFGFIERVDKCWITTVKDLES